MKSLESSGNVSPSPLLLEWSLKTDDDEVGESRLLGTPDEDVWPGVTTLPDYKSTFPNWHPKELGDHVNGSTDESVELLVVRLHASLSLPARGACHSRLED